MALGFTPAGGGVAGYSQGLAGIPAYPAPGPPTFTPAPVRAAPAPPGLGQSPAAHPYGGPLVPAPIPAGQRHVRIKKQCL